MDCKDINDMPYGIAKVIELLYSSKLEEASSLLNSEIKRKAKPVAAGATAAAPKKKRGRRSKAEIEAAKAAEVEPEGAPVANGHYDESEHEAQAKPATPKTPAAKAASKAAQAARSNKSKSKTPIAEQAEDAVMEGFEDALDGIDFE